ncbi:MAG: biotin transporter BioY [Hyphomicrobiales bacterium]|nr:MAG: biotin transporter BioY [Hyphomicrobiales bacterium]
MTTAANVPTLASALWPATRGHSALRAVALVIAGTALLTLSAKIQVPFWPVPMTMQTFVVLMLGAVYGPRLGVATVLAYLAEGAIGLPVFAGGGGLAYMAGPTGGYLAGFIASAALVGMLAQRGFDRRPLTTLVAFSAGTTVLYGLGLAWLSMLFGIENAFALGVVPFVPAEAAKIALAVATLPLAWRLFGRR